MDTKKSSFIDMSIDGKKFPLWVMANFKKYRMKPIVNTGEDPCNVATEKEVNELRNYQKFIGAYFDYRNKATGILLYHGLGSGKTAIALNVYNLLYNYTDGWNVILLIKASLKNDPWLIDMKKWLSKEEYENRYNNIKFVHYDSPYADRDFANTMASVDSSKNTLYIIDEAHNFIKNVYGNITSETGKRAQVIYDLIMEDKKHNRNKCKIIMISATPAVNNPYELALTFNLLNSGKDDLFPRSEDKFNEIYISKDGTSINNNAKNMFQRHILSLVSYYKGSTSDLYAKRNIINKKVRMSDYQYKIYRYFEEIEKKLELNRTAKKGSKIFKSYTRQASNFVFPTLKGIRGEDRPRPSKFKISDAEAEKLGDVNDDKYELYLKMINKYVKTFDDYLQEIHEEDKKNKHTIYDDIETFKTQYNYSFSKFANDGKSKSRLFDELYECSAKFLMMVFYTFKSQGPILIYSNYVKMEGLEILKIYLKYCGFSEFMMNDPSSGKDYHRYLEYSGDVDIETRELNKRAFNDIANIHGKKIRIIMISPAGSEGLSLRNVRQVHITEPYWHNTRIEQVIGRAIRACYHKDIPPEDRIVDIYKYQSVYEDTMKTTDQIIDEQAKIKDELINSFLKLMKQTAIDCELFKDVNMEDEKYMCFQFNQNSYFSNYIGPVYKQDEHQDVRMNDGLDSFGSVVREIKAVKIKVIDNMESEFNAWFDMDTDVVYDFDLKFPIGKIGRTNGVLNRKKKGLYIMDNVIVIPKIKK